MSKCIDNSRWPQLGIAGQGQCSSNAGAAAAAASSSWGTCWCVCVCGRPTCARPLRLKVTLPDSLLTRVCARRHTACHVVSTVASRLKGSLCFELVKEARFLHLHLHFRALALCTQLSLPGGAHLSLCVVRHGTQRDVVLVTGELDAQLHEHKDASCVGAVLVAWWGPRSRETNALHKACGAADPPPSGLPGLCTGGEDREQQQPAVICTLHQGASCGPARPLPGLTHMHHKTPRDTPAHLGMRMMMYARPVSTMSFTGSGRRS
jgi:hypothetical protein